MKAHDQKDLAVSERTENIVALSVFGVLVLLVAGFFTNGFGLFSQNADAGLGENIFVPYDGDPIRGDAERPEIVIYIFSDFECPFCKRGEETVQRVFEKYAGKVVLIFKQFPLTTIHPDSFNAALASECAYEQDKFWEYHDYLFAHQNALSKVDLKAYAVELGLDSEKFNSCLDSERLAAGIAKDVNVGRQIGVTSTPTFIINGHALVGSQPESEFDRIILAELEN